ncbi:outer membrane beta-barrel protein [Parasulfitobacter algicola]|uniref:Porin n=1 Tax=Parasulfitobacter algicola TaxID=2614809 RepID=A0ABX2IPE9_9RHOB|nr:outer membrane beta-barrel protein [Sulfitobacter algicola]NSX54769.1 hypothetical protein [Sulfitobacter algicola]
MIKPFFVFLSTFGIMAASVNAQQFDGAEIGVSTFALTDDSDLGYNQLYGSVEIGLSKRLSFQIDANIYDGYTFDDNTENVMLHTIYDVSDYFSFGLFAGFDYGLQSDDDNTTLFGLEGAYNLGRLDTEWYFGQYHEDGDTATFFGLQGDFALTDAVSVFGDFDRTFIDGRDVKGRRLAIGLAYEFENRAKIFAKVGQFELDADGNDADEPYVQIGASLTFGPNNGTTFSTRSVFESIPNL